jgi:hypothetical protein
MQTPRAESRLPDDGFAASNPYSALNRRGRSESQPRESNADASVRVKPAAPEDGFDPESAPSKTALAEGLDQLPFAESVRILSEAMKAQVRQNQGVGRAAVQADDGAALHPKAGESLNHLLDSLSSALEKAGLESGNHCALQRILGDIRNSVQYGPNATASGGMGAIKKGPNPGLLNLSA